MKNIVFVMPRGAYAVPAVNGGAIETLMTMLVEENELNHNFMFHFIMCKNKSDSNKYTYNYAYSKFYNFYMSDFAIKTDRVLNAGNKRLGYALPLYSSYDNFVAGTIKQVSPDLVIFEGSYNIAVKKLKKLLGKDKLALHIHHQMLPKYDISKYFGHLICPSSFIENDWKNNFDFSSEIKTYTLKNAIDETKFNKPVTEKEKSELRKKLGFADDDFIVIYVGRLIKVKGVLELTEAVKRIDNEKIKLMIVGGSEFKNSRETEYTKMLRANCEELEGRIKFTGYVDNHDLYKYYAISNLHAMPSTWEEAAGLVLLESKTVGIKQLITNSGGMPEYAKSDAVIVKKEENLSENLKAAIIDISSGKSSSSPERPYTKKDYYHWFAEIEEKIYEKNNEKKS